MESRKFGDRWFVRIDRGEEVVETLKAFCREHRVRLGTITGIGATDRAVVGLFRTGTRQYLTREFTGDMEITNLTGNVSTLDGHVYIHLHVTLSDPEYKAWGGHLTSAVISGTLEAVVHEAEGSLERAFDEHVGLNLFRFDA